MSKSTQRPSDAFPGRLRLARATRKLSQEELAGRAQLQASAISHFETGARKPSFDNLRRLADALAVTTDYLIGRVDEMEDTATADRFHRHLRQLSSKDLDFAERFLKSLANEAERNGQQGGRMNRTDLSWRAGLAAGQVIREQTVVALPVDPVAIARAVGIEVRPMPAETGGVSGMLLRAGNSFGIAYATHIESQGFRNFSIAHELGHYFLEGHIDAVLGTGDRHESHAGFGSDDRYELEADHFAASLLMPESLFAKAIGEAGQGLAAIEQLSARCVTSLTATAIRYAQHTGDLVAVVVSAGRRVKYCFMSDALQEVAGNNRISKNDLVPPGTETAEFNKDPDRVRRAERAAGTSDLQDWIGGRYSVKLVEEVVGLGGYGKTLTVLSATGAVDPDELQEDDDLIDSWRPRFRR